MSTINGALGPAARDRFPNVSDAVPAASEMLSVPSPVIPVMLTVRVLPEPLTANVPLAVPVLRVRCHSAKASTR